MTCPKSRSWDSHPGSLGPSRLLLATMPYCPHNLGAVVVRSRPCSGSLVLERRRVFAGLRESPVLCVGVQPVSGQSTAGKCPSFSLTCLRTCDKLGKSMAGSEMKTQGQNLRRKTREVAFAHFPRGRGFLGSLLELLLLGTSWHGLLWLPRGLSAVGLEA